MVVEKAAEAIAGELERASGDCHDKPMFRDAFRRNRCVIPASGYYEWLKKPDGRQPYYITAAGGSVLSFAAEKVRKVDDELLILIPLRCELWTERAIGFAARAGRQCTIGANCCRTGLRAGAGAGRVERGGLL
jgi:hypothetical protein